MDAGPHLLAGHLGLFALSQEDLPPAVGHDAEDADEVPEWAEAAGRDVALWRGGDVSECHGVLLQCSAAVQQLREREKRRNQEVERTRYCTAS
jgi:hypothetical protein